MEKLKVKDFSKFQDNFELPKLARYSNPFL